MDEKEQLKEQFADFGRLDKPAVNIEEKLDELIVLLERSELASESIRKMHLRFNAAVWQAGMNSDDDLKSLEVFDKIMPREDPQGNLEQLPVSHSIDSKLSERSLRSKKMKRAGLLLVALILIVLGFAMIIMPAPPYFEMSTIFLFSPDDRVTLRDMISLLTVFTGVYLFITSVIKLNTVD